MSTIFFDIAMSLYSSLNTIDNVTPIDWENSPYLPTIGVTYLKQSHIPNETVQVTAGSAGSDLYSGIYHVAVNVESGRGIVEAMVLADKIATKFKRGSNHSSNGVIVNISSVTIGNSSSIDGWYIVPVEIRYRSFNKAR